MMPATNARVISPSVLCDVSRHIFADDVSTASETFMLLHIHRSLTDDINLLDVANDFIAGHDHRKHVFDTEFKPAYLL